MSWWVYLLRCGDGTLYTGITDDLDRRLAAHNAGKGAKYTRCRLPVTMVYREEVPDKSAALQREWAVKQMKRSEKLDMIEPFHPDRMASRILGMGDMLSFIEKAQQTYDEKQAKKLEEKLKKNSFTLSDYFDQLQQIRNMGDLSQLAGMMPGNLGNKLQGAQIDEKAIAHTEAIILSMTPEERENPQILGASRKKRIAAGCGLDVVDVNRLLKQFEGMQQIIKQVTGGRKPGFGFGGLGHGRGLRKRKKK